MSFQIAILGNVDNAVCWTPIVVSCLDIFRPCMEFDDGV